MRTLDRSRPMSEIFGMEPVKFEQDGLYFLGNGELAPGSEPPPEPRSDLIDRILGPIEEDDDPVPPPRPVMREDDMRLKENRALKAQMEAFGETWQGVEHAKKFLGIIE